MSAMIELERGSAVAPNAVLRGRVSWQLSDAPTTARLRLRYTACGGGAEAELSVVLDLDVGEMPGASSGAPYRGQVTAEAGAALGAEETRVFELRVPDSPYSYAGHLVEITWHLELVLEPGGVVATTELVVSPSGAVVTPG